MIRRRPERTFTLFPGRALVGIPTPGAALIGVVVSVSSLLSGCSVATDPVDYQEFVSAEGEGELGIWVHSGLYNRTYVLLTPPNLGDGGSRPLLIFLHGAGGTGESFYK